MNSNFEDKNLVIHYIQQLLNETYNPGIHVTGEYYKTFNMNYGFAHYIAKYLDRTFPILDEQTKQDYENIPLDPFQDPPIRDIKKPISILNYFLANNRERILQYPVTSSIVRGKSYYEEIYNKYMMVHYNQSTNAYSPIYDGKYMINNDLPLFTTYNDGTYNVSKNTIYRLSAWDRKKEICELDDLIVSYLLGRTITPNSLMEEIYYVQTLLIRDRGLYPGEKGNWNFKRPDGTTLTDTIMSFQRSCQNNYDSVPILVTGYFDIFTEQRAKMNIVASGDLSVHGL